LFLGTARTVFVAIKIAALPAAEDAISSCNIFLQYLPQ